MREPIEGKVERFLRVDTPRRSVPQLSYFRGMRYSAGFILSWPFLYGGALLFRLIAPLFRRTRDRGTHPWVIGGHRGRMYADNAAALHTHIVTQTDTPVIWISMNPDLTAELRKRGHKVLTKNSFAARLAILRAPVLIYSHGEDDLDMGMRLFRKGLGLRVFLFHCMSHLKGGQWERGGMETWSRRQLARYAWEMTDFDILPTSSPSEKVGLDRCFRDGVHRILPYGGGAHLDFMLQLREQPAGRHLLWFPTFRDTPAEQQKLEDMIHQITASPELHQWLETADLELAVVRHINTGTSLQKKTPHPRISFHGPDQLLPLMGGAAAYISDYSGTILDWLCFGRPMIFFPFDQDTYLLSRKLLVSLEDLHFGPLVHSPEALLSVLRDGTWKDASIWNERRSYWMQKIYPDLRPGFAQRCYQTIVNLRKHFDERSRTFIAEEST